MFVFLRGINRAPLKPLYQFYVIISMNSNSFIYIFGCMAISLMIGGCKNNQPSVAEDNITEEPASPSFSADSAYNYVAAQCNFGPRTMNSEAHEKCAEWLVGKFRQFGANVTLQEAPSKLYDGTPISIKNIIAVFNDSCDGRIQISSHWDSRPWADNDNDENYHNTPIDGANDGASGVGILIELARQIQLKNPGIGIELVCWDAEDAGSHGIDATNSWCIGSQYWAANHTVDGFRYVYGILLDMVGGKNTYFRKESASMYYAPTIVDKVWSTAQRLGYGKYFLNEDGGSITDDHIQVNKSGIPCIDIIGSNANGSGFPDTWHTMDDNIKNIDKDVLKAVGQTLMEIIYEN